MFFIENMVVEFYIIEALLVLVLKRYTPFRHSHEKFINDLLEFREKFNDKLAAIIFDYTVKACAGELRYCEERSMRYLSYYEYDEKSSRRKIYREIIGYTPSSILQASLELFNPEKNEWDYCFGGKPWYLIAKAATLYKKVPNVIFIDHCVDLTHNGGVYFNKSNDIFHLEISNSEYINILNKKSRMKPIDFIYRHVNRFSKDTIIAQLLGRATVLNFIPNISNCFSDSKTIDEERMLNCVLPNWGKENLEFIVAAHKRRLWDKERIRYERRGE